MVNKLWGNEAMSYPGEGMEGMYRNDINQVAAYLDHKHHDHYMIFNLSERNYNISLFHGCVVDFGWPDHHGPPLQVLIDAVADVDRWLQTDARNVAIVHCLAGRGRTGTLICAYLCFAGYHRTMQKALQYYANVRSNKNKGVTQPSQLRYCKYIDLILNKPLVPRPKCVTISRITITPVPNFTSQLGIRPILNIYKYSSGELTLIWSSIKGDENDAPHFVPKDGEITFDTSDMPPFTGDVMIKLSHVTSWMWVSSKSENIMRVIMNTSFFADGQGVLTLAKRDLDIAHKDPRFHPETQIFIYTNTSTNGPPPTQKEWDPEVFEPWAMRAKELRSARFLLEPTSNLIISSSSAASSSSSPSSSPVNSQRIQHLNGIQHPIHHSNVVYQANSLPLSIPEATSSAPPSPLSERPLRDLNGDLTLLHPSSVPPGSNSNHSIDNGTVASLNGKSIGEFSGEIPAIDPLRGSTISAFSIIDEYSSKQHNYSPITTSSSPNGNSIHSSSSSLSSSVEKKNAGYKSLDGPENEQSSSIAAPAPVIARAALNQHYISSPSVLNHDPRPRKEDDHWHEGKLNQSTLEEEVNALLHHDKDSYNAEAQGLQEIEEEEEIRPEVEQKAPKKLMLSSATSLVTPASLPSPVVSKQHSKVVNDEKKENEEVVPAPEVEQKAPKKLMLSSATSLVTPASLPSPVVSKQHPKVAKEAKKENEEVVPAPEVEKKAPKMLMLSSATSLVTPASLPSSVVLKQPTESLNQDNLSLDQDNFDEGEHQSKEEPVFEQYDDGQFVGPEDYSQESQ